MRSPIFLAHCIRRFGDLQLKQGGSLLYYRHLIFCAQRKVPGLKMCSSTCWDLAALWQHVEPVTHPVLVPLPAIVPLARQPSRRRWAAVSAICFFGIAARAGEVLRCRRKDHLLPSDFLQDSGGAAYVVLWQSKTSQSQAASVQHLKITGSKAVSLLASVYRGVSADESLFPGTPAIYRRRWGHLLVILGVPRSLHS